MEYLSTECPKRFLLWMNKNALGKIQLTNDILKKVNIQTPEIEKHMLYVGRSDISVR